MSPYDAGVPTTLAPYPDRTLLDYLTDLARDRANHPALLFKGATITWGGLERLSDACASAFHALGIKRGDRIALLLPNCPQFSIAQFAAWKLGAIVAPLNPIYTEHELEGPLREHGVETIVTLTRFYHRVKRVQPRTPVQRVIATNIKEHFPAVLKVLFTLLREKRDGDRIALAPGDHDFAHLLLVNRGRRGPGAAVRAADPAVLLMSGGTTGTPKGVLGTHGAYVMAGLHLRAAAAVPRVRQRRLASVRPDSRRPTGARSKPARPQRSDRDDSPRQAGILQRCADAVHRSPQPPGRPERQGRLQVDQDLLLRRGSAAGRHEAAFRSAHRCAHRRGVFVDRSDDGGVREPGQRREQARIGRNGAARRAS